MKLALTRWPRQAAIAVALVAFSCSPARAIEIESFGNAGLEMQADTSNTPQVLVLSGDNPAYPSTHTYTLALVPHVTFELGQNASVHLIPTVTFEDDLDLSWQGGPVSFSTSVENSVPVDLTDGGLKTRLYWTSVITFEPGTDIGSVTFTIDHDVLGHREATFPVIAGSGPVGESQLSLLDDGTGTGQVSPFFSSFVGTIGMTFTSSVDEGSIQMGSYYTAVPEPSTVVLLLTGGMVLGVGWLRRRRHQRGSG